MKKIILSEHQINEIVKLYQDGLGLKKIYNITNISPDIIKKKLIEIGIYIKPKNYKYSLDERIFQKIDNEEKSYWLGFLFADGYVRKKKCSCEMRLKLSIMDVEHLNKFKQFLKSDAPIRKCISEVPYPTFISVSENVFLSIYSKHLYEDLVNLGCTPNKTHRLGKPNIDDSQMKHFLRGYFDGDGCISINKNNVTSVNFTSSSLTIIEWINKYLNENSICSYRNLHKNGGAHTLNYTNKNDIKNIYKFLYQDCTIYLNRKKDKFEKVLDSYQPIKVTQKNIDGTIKNYWDDVTTAAIHFGIKRNDIIDCCENVKNTLKGYKWEYTKYTNERDFLENPNTFEHGLPI